MFVHYVLHGDQYLFRRCSGRFQGRIVRLRKEAELITSRGRNAEQRSQRYEMLALASRNILFYRFIVGTRKRDRPMFGTEKAVFAVPGPVRRAGRHVEHVLRRPSRRRRTSTSKDRATPESNAYCTGYHRWHNLTSFSELL